MLTQDPLAVVEGRPYSRGLIIGVATGLACALILLAIDVVESVDSAQHSAAPFPPGRPPLRGPHLHSRSRHENAHHPQR